MNNRLTIKQEKFIQNLIQGMSQREAYKNAYNALNMKDETIDTKACNLLKKDKVGARYNELLEEIRKKDLENSIMTAEKRRKWLSDIINGKEKETLINKIGGVSIPLEVDVDITTKLKALDILNKMDGEYTQKVENKVTMSYEEELQKVVDEDEY